MRRSPCAEFPNDNPLIHEGTVWSCPTVTAKPWPQRTTFEHGPLPSEMTSSVAEGSAVRTGPSIRRAVPREGELTKLLQTSTSVFEDEADEPVALVPAEVADGIVVEEFDDSFLDESLALPAPPPDLYDIVAEEQHFERASGVRLVAAAPVDVDTPEVHVPAPATSTADDPFYLFARIVGDVALAAGDARLAAALPTLLYEGEVKVALLGDDVALSLAKENMVTVAGDMVRLQERCRQAADVWRAMLRGEAADFSACAVMLDEWASDVLARALRAPARVSQLRQELRLRGVAAFGLVLAA